MTHTTPVSDAARMDFLPALVGKRAFVTAEAGVYRCMSKFCLEYTDAYWAFMRLSNGGGFLYPDMKEPLMVSVPGNGFDGELSSEAAGIVMTLFVLSKMSFPVHGMHGLKDGRNP